MELLEKPKKRLRKKSDALEEAEAVFAGVSTETEESAEEESPGESSPEQE